MNVKLLYTGIGVIIGDVAENETGYVVTDPLAVVFSEKGFMLQDIFIGTAETEDLTTLTLDKLQVVGTALEPHVAIRNNYTQTVGGIQLV